MSIHLDQQKANSVLRALVFYAYRGSQGEFRKILQNLILLQKAEEQHEEYITAKLMSELGVNVTLEPLVQRVEPEPKAVDDKT